MVSDVGAMAGKAASSGTPRAPVYDSCEADGRFDDPLNLLLLLTLGDRGTGMAWAKMIVQSTFTMLMPSAIAH